MVPTSSEGGCGPDWAVEGATSKVTLPPESFPSPTQLLMLSADGYYSLTRCEKQHSLKEHQYLGHLCLVINGVVPPAARECLKNNATCGLPCFVALCMHACGVPVTHKPPESPTVRPLFPMMPHNFPRFWILKNDVALALESARPCSSMGKGYYCTGPLNRSIHHLQ